jgi:hypothetical protein
MFRLRDRPPCRSLSLPPGAMFSFYLLNIKSQFENPVKLNLHGQAWKSFRPEYEEATGCK